MAAAKGSSSMTAAAVFMIVVVLRKDGSCCCGLWWGGGWVGEAVSKVMSEWLLGRSGRCLVGRHAPQKALPKGALERNKTRQDKVECRQGGLKVRK